MHRTWAIVERELRRFRRSPLLIIMSLIFPLLQLLVLGYAFGGNVRNLTIAVVDQDHSEISRRFVEALNADEATRVGPRRWRGGPLTGGGRPSGG